MKQAYIAIGISLFLVMAIVLSIVYINQKPRNSGVAPVNEDADVSNTEIGGKLEKKEADKVETSLVHGDLLRIDPSKTHRFSFDLKVTSGSEAPRIWGGEFSLRTEPVWSETKIKRKIYAGPAKEYQLLSQQFGTGLLVPRRWILVGNKFVEGATTVTVFLDGKPTPARVRTRLKKSEFAVLEVESGNFPKVPYSEVEGFRRKWNLAWLDAEGNLQIQRDLKHNSANGYQGGTYRFNGTVREDSVGGVGFDENGNITGLIVDSIYPVPDQNPFSQVHPMKRIAKTWSEKNQKILFGAKRSEPPKDLEQSIRNRLVRVKIERPAAEQPNLPIFVESTIAAPDLQSGRTAGFHRPATTIKQKIKYDVSTAPFRVQDNLRAKQIPFFLGDLHQQILFPYQDLQFNLPISISQSGFRLCDLESADGMFESKLLTLERRSDSIVGSRRITLKTEASPLPGLVGASGVDLVCQHDFKLRISDNLPIQSSVQGNITIGTKSGPEEFAISMKINLLDN